MINIENTTAAERDIISNITEQSDEKALAMLSAIIKEVGA